MLPLSAPAVAAPPTARAHVFPPPLEHRYAIHAGRLQTRSLEAHVVDHCNLTCAECCSLSPLLPERLTDPAELADDLRLAARALQPRIFKLVGGEPLLHPEIVSLIEIAKAAAIAPVVSITTNGLKLGEMPDRFWQQVDALTLSRYPRPRLSAALVSHIETMAERFAVRLNWKTQDTFSQMTRPQPTTDLAATTQIYATCWLRERCHLLRAGRFYSCTRPVHFHTLQGGQSDFRDDGIVLHDGPGLAEDILTYLQRETPLQACFHCHGGSAPQAPHRLLRRIEVLALRAATP